MPDLYELVKRALFVLDAERAHSMTMSALKTGVVRRAAEADPILRSSLAGLDLPSPLGLAAGFDKNAEVPDRMLKLGFGFVECGTVTPRPQAGNPRPRLFRDPSHEAVINRFGFNNAGGRAFLQNLARARLRMRGRDGVIGVNIGRNKETDDPVGDYVALTEMMTPMADYLTVNVSSPNTPGLREMQGREALTGLLEAVLAARDRAADGGTATVARPPVLVKIAPDLNDADIADIVAVLSSVPVDGAILTNTTIERPDDLPAGFRDEAGGLSGRPLFQRSTALLREVAGALGGRLPLVGVGGVSSADDALAKIRAGASAVQLYTGLVFQGPGLVSRINADLASLVRAEGARSITDLVGADLTSTAR